MSRMICSRDVGASQQQVGVDLEPALPLGSSGAAGWEWGGVGHLRGSRLLWAGSHRTTGLFTAAHGHLCSEARGSLSYRDAHYESSTLEVVRNPLSLC